MNYYELLHDVATKIATDYSDEGDENERAVEVMFQTPYGSNYPWIYLTFDVTGGLSLWQMKRIEERFQEFLREHGGNLENISFGMSKLGSFSFKIKLTYVEGYNYKLTR